jgi:A/G-specific adenine glycosylase
MICIEQQFTSIQWLIDMDDHSKQKLIQWFHDNKRDLPWRENPNPYAVWVSEIMLQQTQVAVVIPYFLRWMSIFPSISALAEASLDSVIKCWEGLGYYSRARSLHAGARYIVDNYEGVLPTNPEALIKIPGIGPYTCGAILSFAFKQKAPAVDGNVIRVLTRFYNNHSDISKSTTIKEIWSTAAAILPDKEPWSFNEALIELGATICNRAPKCFQCPLNSSCKAYAENTVAELPFKSAKTQIEQLYRAVAVIKAENKLLVRRGAQGKLMSDLHEFPYFESKSPERDIHWLSGNIRQTFGIDTKFNCDLPDIEHSFTRYRVKLFPAILTSKAAHHIDGYQWLSQKELEQLAFSSGHRRILQLL